MRLLRGLAGALLWILSALLGLVAVILCVTVILLPVGLPLLGYARRMFTLAVRLMLPRAVAHPTETAAKSMRKRSRRTKAQLADAAPDPQKMTKPARKKARHLRKRTPLAS